MKTINYILKGFGYENATDYRNSCYGLFVSGEKVDIKMLIVAIAGAVRLFLNQSMGFDLPVFCAFVFLIGAEFYTGVKVSRKIKGERFKSRPLGRMIIKIGTYLIILSVLNTFSKNIDAPDVMGVDLNPFAWLYYTVFIAIVIQLMISWLENLGSLGYRETKTIAGFILRRFNKWFEFDGSKNNDDDYHNS